MYGLYLSAGYILFSLITHFTDTWRGAMLWGFPVLLIMMIVAVVMAIKDRRRESEDGSLRFTQGFSTGFTVVLISAVLISLYSLVYSEYINPDFDKAVKEFQVSWMPESVPQEAKDEILYAESDPLMDGIGQILGLMIMGGIITAICAAALKRNPAPKVMD
jgi:lysylphosphatidylglycerol synthetase-like protein (DUF2156 family)